MDSIKLLKTNNPNSVYGILTWLFVFSGAKFYMDYLLITNPISKNPIIKFIFKKFKKSYSAFEYKNRYYQSYMFGFIHIIFFLLWVFGDMYLTLSNLLVNVYPIIIQIYIGYRCWRIKNKSVNLSK